MTETTYLTFVPYVNRKDLLFRALAGIRCMWPRTLVIDNSEENELAGEQLPVAVYRPCVPLQFAQTMNLTQRFAFEGGCGIFFFLHADAAPGEEAAQRLLAHAQALSSHWGVIFTNGDAFCCFRSEAVKTVGPWDWRGLNWYFADKDYYYRIRLAGFEAVTLELPVEHVASQTRGADRYIETVVAQQLTAARTYYMLKWGGAPEQEVYRSPFNGELQPNP